MVTQISIVICTHNPRLDYLNRVLQSLNSQTLTKHFWELLLVDNASNDVLSKHIDLSWHPNAQHIREEQLGLTPARIRGIKESTADTIVFVDDDNVLDLDYLKITLGISRKWENLGAWSGQVRAEFETNPPEWIKSYLGALAIREFDRDSWSNFIGHNPSTPCGAGLCIRKSVAEHYATKIIQDVRRIKLGRTGNKLTSCEDSDIAYTACDIGLGTGQFASLKLTHLIPSQRLQKEYMERLIEGMNYSGVMLNHLRGSKVSLTKRSVLQKLIDFYRLTKMSDIDRRMSLAAKRGQRKAISEILNFSTQEKAL